jgi:hypothetical protein
MGEGFEKRWKRNVKNEHNGRSQKLEWAWLLAAGNWVPLRIGHV